MAKKKYDFDYDNGEAFVVFEVDLDKFTPEMANVTLEFFSWDYDEDADPIDEVMKKYAMRAIKLATQNGHNEFGVKSDFEEEEGYGRVDGSIGITLLGVGEYEFMDDRLSVVVTDL